MISFKDWFLLFEKKGNKISKQDLQNIYNNVKNILDDPDIFIGTELDPGIRSSLYASVAILATVDERTYKNIITHIGYLNKSNISENLTFPGERNKILNLISNIK